VVLPSEPQMRAPTNLWRDAARRFFKNKLAVIALIAVVMLIFVAVFAGFLAPYPYDYAVPSEALQFPSPEHPFGTDAVGRDFLSRMIYGARVSLIVGFSVQAIALLIGLPFGILGGMSGGWVDYVVMRWVEVLTAIPIWLFALFLISVWRGTDEAIGSGLLKVIVAIGLIGWVDICRLTRAQILSLRQKDYVLSAHAIGSTQFQIARRHLMPNAISPLLVAITLGIPAAIFTEAGLSVLGFGINDPLPSWGKMVADSSSYIRVYWYLGLLPTLAISITMLSFSFVGDGLRDALDPHLSK
jgi:ABC-type dipeptide/oligopeptide/nickel transport system permease subunit